MGLETARAYSMPDAAPAATPPELARRGFNVWSVDRSPELIAVARARHPKLIIADLLELSFRRPFDAVLCRGVLNDRVEDASRAAVMRQFA